MDEFKAIGEAIGPTLVGVVTAAVLGCIIGKLAAMASTASIMQKLKQERDDELKKRQEIDDIVAAQFRRRCQESLLHPKVSDSQRSD